MLTWHHPRRLPINGLSTDNTQAARCLGPIAHFLKVICNDLTDNDLLALMGVHKLALDNCRGITSLSALGGVYELSPYDCQGITDVSALGGVHTLSLKFCKRIMDVSALGLSPRSRHLSMGGSRNSAYVIVTRSQTCWFVHNLTIAVCDGRVYDLKPWHCNKITGV